MTNAWTVSGTTQRSSAKATQLNLKYSHYSENKEPNICTVHTYFQTKPCLNLMKFAHQTEFVHTIQNVLLIKIQNFWLKDISNSTQLTTNIRALIQVISPSWLYSYSSWSVHMCRQGIWYKLSTTFLTYHSVIQICDRYSVFKRLQF
jgi:hypothetical protein